MSNEWDRDANILTEEEIEIEKERQRREERAEWERLAEERRIYRETREREDYFTPEGMPREEVIERFPYWQSRVELYANSYSDNNGLFMPHWPNKLWFVCHNCGHIGWKYGRCNKLFKCLCGSRNGVVIRAGHISKILRENPEYSTNLEDVFNERQERNRSRRAQRSIRRRNAQREA